MAGTARRKINIFRVISIGVVLLVVIGVLALLLPRPQMMAEKSPVSTLQEIRQVIKTGNVSRFEELIDVDRLSENLVDGAFSAEDTAAGNAMEKAVGWLSSRYNTFIRPDVVKSVRHQLLTLAAGGSLNGEDDFLPRLWKKISGDTPEVFRQFGPVEKGENWARVAVLLHRSDLEADLSAKLLMEKTDAGSWRLVGVENLRNLLQNIEVLEKAAWERENAKRLDRMRQVLEVTALQKSSGLSKWGVGQGILLRIAFKNKSRRDVSSFRAQVEFAEKPGGKPLKTVTISDSDGLKTGQVSEKSWPMSINPLSPAEAEIHKRKQEELEITVSPLEIHFADGTFLSLLEGK